ncbi:MAG: hypothetical protein RL336_819, partial [Pseudomonadota bacterium]
SFVTVTGGMLATNNKAASVTLGDLPTPSLAPIADKPWNILVTGIGGTGVLTISALVSMAAHIEGKGCATMNQTGLAQKFGAVVSHVRIGATQDAINSVRIPAGDADLLLGCDLVVAASDEAIAKVNIERSHAIVNDFEAMTAEFITDPDLAFPAEGMKATLREEVGADKVTFINATDLATHLFGDSIASNVFLLGYAYQQGLIPVGHDAILEAIELNKVQVELNKRAFAWGRHAAVDIANVINVADIHSKPSPLEDLDAIIADRAERLTDYQDKAYADLYVARLQPLIAAESALNGDGALSKTAARQLYRAMAYKDEYEVARLFSAPSFHAQLGEVFQGEVKLDFHLSPPLLAGHDKDLNRPSKYLLPGWLIQPAFKLLQFGKILRGSAFDIFGYSEERRRERQLIEHYNEDIRLVCDHLNQQNTPQAHQLLECFASVRGYGPVKMSNVDRYHEQRQQWRQHFAQQGVDTIKFVNAA